MNDDFEEDYDEYDEADFLEDAKQTYDDIKDAKAQYDKYKNRGKEGNSSNPQQDARNYDKQLRDKNMARGQNPQGAQQAGTEVAKQTGKQVATQAGSGAAASGTAASSAAASGAAAAGGAVAAQAAIPVAGWIALAIEAVIALGISVKKAIKKHDAKMAENGVDSKGIRRLLKMSPILLPIALIVLILIIFVQAETMEKVDFLDQAVSCFEGNATGISCNDFMNTKVNIVINDKPVIKATDWDIAEFVVKFVTAENRYYGSGGSAFLTDIVTDLNDVAKEGLLDDRTQWQKIVDAFEQLVEDSIIGDINYAWHLFKWIKMEKKVFNNIDWYKEYPNTKSGCATIDTMFSWVNYGLMKNEPQIGFLDTTSRASWEWGWHGFDQSYLNVPVSISVDTAIEAAKPYIPSWIELYATYVATGDYKLCNAMYDYYTDKDEYKLEITLYQLLTVTKTQKVEGSRTTKYYVDKGKGSGYETVTEEQFNQLKDDSGDKSFWSWLGDAIKNFYEKVKEILKKLGDMIAELLGFNVHVSESYTTIVTKGNAYKYKVNQKYNIYTEEPTVETKKKAESREKSHSDNFSYRECKWVRTGEYWLGVEIQEYRCTDYTSKFKTTATVYMDHIITTWQNKLKYESASISEYEHETRYRQVFMEMIEDKDLNYTLDDVAMAIEVIDAHYNEQYLSNGMSIDYSALPDGEFGWPVPANKVVSALFGYTSWYGSNHGGIDVWAVDSSGNPSASLSYVKTVDIVAAQAGKVVQAYNGGCADGNLVSSACAGGYGNYVKIEHENNYSTIYAHLSPGTIAVSVGQQVTAGQYLGKMGSSGNSSGTHLHFEIQFDGNRLDPLAFYEVESYAYNVPYANRNATDITMANPYKVNFDL